MARDNYIPGNDEGFRFWAQSLARCIEGQPEKYRFSIEEAAELAASVSKFTAAYEVSNNVGTRTRITIADKNAARKECERMCRRFAMAIKDERSISDEDRICAGVPLVNTKRKRVPKPSTAPLLHHRFSLPGSHILVFADADTPDRKCKPWYASEMQLFVAITRESDAPVSEAKFLRSCTRTPVTIEFDSDADGKFATYYGRWANPRGETGPWSLPVSVMIAA